MKRTLLQATFTTAKNKEDSVRYLQFVPSNSSGIRVIHLVLQTHRPRPARMRGRSLRAWESRIMEVMRWWIKTNMPSLSSWTLRCSLLLLLAVIRVIITSIESLSDYQIIIVSCCDAFCTFPFPIIRTLGRIRTMDAWTENSCTISAVTALTTFQ